MLLTLSPAVSCVTVTRYDLNGLARKTAPALHRLFNLAQSFRAVVSPVLDDMTVHQRSEIQLIFERPTDGCKTPSSSEISYGGSEWRPS